VEEGDRGAILWHLETFEKVTGALGLEVGDAEDSDIAHLKS
jgi:hypothetical protein